VTDHDYEWASGGVETAQSLAHQGGTDAAPLDYNTFEPYIRDDVAVVLEGVSLLRRISTRNRDSVIVQ
jgi:hypothetical protein